MPDRPAVRQRRLRSRISEVVAMAGPESGHDRPGGTRTVGVARHQRAGASDKMTIGVTYEGALGKLITTRAISGRS